MAKRTWNFVDKWFNENDLQSYLAENIVSVKRTEETANGKKIIYRCSKYRKYPECDYQVKVVSNYDGEITVSTSNSHNHDHRASTTRAPSPVRDIIKNAAAAGLTQSQTRRSIENQYKGVVSHSQLSSLLNYHRPLAIPDVYSIDDFRSWCHQHSALLTDPMSIHEPFVAKFYINSCNELFVFITTRKLISAAPLSGLLQVDATFKLNWNELPVLVFGSSDGNRRFHPYGIAIIGTDEAASSYITLFQTIKECVFNVTGKVI
jgi:hypothetical protein